MRFKLLTSIVLFGFGSASLNTFAANDFIFRGTAAYVSPNDSSGRVLGNDGVSVDSEVGVGLAVTYMFDDHWGFEVLAATPFRHNIDGTGELGGLAIGETKQLPPTFSVTYTWGDDVLYHVGGGLNYTTFFEEKTTTALTSALGANSTSLELEDSTGFAFQFGFDVPISESWDFSAGIYYMDIDTTADVYINGAKVVSVDVEIDPVVLTLGFGTRF